MYLDVGDGHRLYYEEYGPPTGRPIIVLHGGPGGALSHGVLKNFNLKKDRVILYDQRGCGKSTPYLSLYKNTTWDLVADMEKLRHACGVQKWILFGGSWGTTLALAYVSKHMEYVSALVLRGVCLMEPWETKWLYHEGGASRLYPQEWEAFSSFAASASGGRRSKDLTKTYKRLLRNRQTRKAAAAAWWGWESAISSLKPTTDRTIPAKAVSLAVLENHFFSNNAWIRPGQLLRTAAKIPRSVPVIIVQGRYDLVCPPAAAVALAKAIPHAKLTLTIAGHSSADPENARGLRKALARLRYVH